MRIGITVLYQHSFFSAGSPQTALALAEVFHLSGHTVSFLNLCVPQSKETPPATWWDDVQTLKKEWKTVQLEELDTVTEPPFDLLLEIGSHILKPEQRKKAAKTSVWVCRKPALMSDIESTLFPFLTHPERNLDGVKGVWVFDAMTTPDDIEYLEVQTRLPVQVIPFVWTPSALELHRQSTQAPVWPQVASHPDIVKANRPWEFHVCETNTSSTSSCTIPLFIAAELKKKKKSIHASHKVIIHNADNIRHGEFFQKNVFEKMFSDISGEFVGRMRCADLVYAPMSCVLAHSRFLQIRPYLLDCLWVGVPTLHNSPFLRDKFGDSVFHKYYPDNEITKGYSALEQLLQSSKQTETTKALEQLMETRKRIMSLVAPFSPVVQKGITDALQTLLTSSSVSVTPVQQKETKTLPGIDQIWLVNLDRRQDRLEKFYATHPDLKGSVTRLPAFDGKQLKLTDRLARLFVPNDFKWKKPVMGCALSHLAIWMNLLSHDNQNKAFLVLEDDVVLQKGWQDRWNAAWNAKAIPDNWDVLYLGGLLPPNKPGFETAVEKVNEHVGKMKTHNLFGPQPNRYMHFCTYAYAISRRGAEKVVEFMKAKGGVWTSADHLMCNLFEILNLYFLHPLPAGCYQDDDPVYCNSAFNDYNRKDNFDSDLWNNNEHFSDDEVKEALGGKVLPLDVLGALEDARKTVSVPPPFGTAEGKSKSAPASLEEHPLAPIRIGFCDMWADFNAECNQFLAIVQDVLKEKEKRNVKGFDLQAMTPGQEAVDLVVFGPFGQRWRSVQEGIPLVFYTGENSPPPTGDPRVKLTLGFDRKAFSIRLPLWMLEINWFGLNPDEVGNPKPFPLDLATKPQISEREKFCAFVVSNPCQEKRNTAFHWLHAYKPIDSAGRLFNNVGSDIFAGLGGGGGELKKIEFFRKYKFALTYENAESPGYCTEKMLHAKVAGCIPIYWGDPEVEEDFDVRGFIDARQVKSAEELIQKVKEVETNKYLYHEMRSIPALDAQREAKARAVLREVGEKMLGLIKQTSKNTTSVNLSEKVHVSANNTVFVTAASQAFLPSLQLWLQSVTAQKEANPKMQIHVYCMTDISDSLLAQYKESFPLATFHRFPTDAPTQFPDLWAPQHFAWKLWIYKTFVQKEEFRGKLIFYFDSGAMLVRYPKAWMTQVAEQGLVMLDDESQVNRTWCHAEFRKALSVSKEELDAHQIWAGGMAFVGGHSLPRAVFEEAWKWGQQRSVIVGVKEYPVEERVDGCKGHRHDQSILSIVSMRHKISRIPLNAVHNHVSLRLTFLTGACIYVHRGNFCIHKQLLQGIDNAWVINLDRRADRMQRFNEAHPELLHEVIRHAAYDGRSLQLTPSIACLFAPNDFKWKKSVMGCALSHLDLWMKLVNDKPDIQSYLVLEDDVVLKDSWNLVWNAAYTSKSIPEDWDIIYLGGILPPNRKAFEEKCIEKLNMFVGRIKPNTEFGHTKPTPYMHFCNYAYVISRKGAMKVLEVLKTKGGYWTSADHMICNLYDSMNMYFLHPLVAGCVQDNDPAYQESNFRDFSRIDTFDSDLWNNNDRFSEQDIAAALQRAPSAIDIQGALRDAANPHAKQSNTEKPRGRRLVTVAGGKWNAYETQWLCDLMGYDIPIEDLSATATTDIPEDQPIVLFQRPHCDAIRAVLERWRAKGVCFFLLHLSDEWCKDPIDIYSWKECLGVIRNYVRADCPNSDKVKTIPIGYHWKAKTNPSASERSLTWSFAGTGWKDRDQKLKVLQDIIPTTELHLQKGWESDDKLSEEKMLALYERSMCIPCPGGQNPETFRVYEALEAGAIPVLVKEEGNTSYLAFLNTWLPLLHCENWDHAGKLIQTLKAKPEVYEQYRQHVLEGWTKMKVELQGWVRSVFRV